LIKGRKLAFHSHFKHTPLSCASEKISLRRKKINLYIPNIRKPLSKPHQNLSFKSFHFKHPITGPKQEHFQTRSTCNPRHWKTFSKQTLPSHNSDTSAQNGNLLDPTSPNKTLLTEIPKTELIKVSNTT